MKNGDLVNQFTLNGEISISGTGLHTGLSSTVTLKPADSDFGIRFKRVDLPGQPVIRADVDNVVDTSRSTTIEQDGARVSTIEHLLAALAGMQVDNVLIEVDAPEVPIMDGSSMPFIEAVEKTGVREQDAEKVFYTIKSNIELIDTEKRVEMTALPSDEFQVTALIDFDSPVLRTQHASLKSLKDFKTEIAPCRTFVFFHELEYLLEHNLIKGGSPESAIVVVDRKVSKAQLDHFAKVFHLENVKVKQEGIGILNNVPLRFTNEPARHKLLDVVGDLSLVGYPVKAHIIANRPGHSTNVAFAKKIKDHIRKNRYTRDVPEYNPNKAPLYDIAQIEKVLPHRFPFLLVDKIIELTEKTVVGIKNVTFDEYFFQGHFPGNPVMPGVLQLEALAQAGGILALNTYPDPENYDTYFLKIDKCKFKRMIFPGDTMILSLELLNPIRRGICEMKGTIFVGERICTEAILVAKLMRREA